MRLPTVGDHHANVDQPEAIRMIRQAIDRGVNLLASGYVYHCRSTGRAHKRVKEVHDGEQTRS
jgi:predicted aldo/keto reductase-like oxidoreductase